jgi:hypothetical protein
LSRSVGDKDKDGKNDKLYFGEGKAYVAEVYSKCDLLWRPTAIPFLLGLQ